MKKLTSIFLGCMMITCAFTSCGDKDDSKSEKSDKKEDTNPIVGIWEGDIDGQPGRYTFSENGKLTMSMEWSEYLAMEDGKCMVGGSDVTDYLEFDGSDFILSESGTEIINMKKTEKTDADDFDGEYDVQGGYLADAISSQFGEGEFNISITFDGSATFFNIKDIADYKIDGDKITLENMPESMSEDGETSAELNFELDGDSLTLTDPEEEDKIIEFTRVK
jgi:lipoprotein